MLVVTGAAGFIGSNLLAALDGEHSAPIGAIDVIDSEEKRLNVAKRRNVNWIEPNDTLPFLNESRADVDGLIHLGAETSTAASDRTAVFATNVDLSRTLWAWCAAHGVPFVYASSASVYGNGSQGFRDGLDLAHMRALEPLNLYGETKLAFDVFAADAASTGAPTPPSWAGLRFFNVYGPHEFHKGAQGSVVTQMQPTAARGEPYPLFRSHRDGIADGEQQRDFVFVDDCVAVTLWALRQAGLGGIFNVGTGQARTFMDLARAVYSASDQPFAVSWRDTPEHLQAHYQYFTQADLSELRAAGYGDAFTSLEDGVTITVRDYLNTSDPYR